MAYPVVPFGEFPLLPEGFLDLVGRPRSGPSFRTLLVPPPGIDIDPPNGADWEPARMAGRTSRLHGLWWKDGDDCTSYDPFGKNEAWALGIDFDTDDGLPVVGGAISITHGSALGLPGPADYQEVWGVDPLDAFRRTFTIDGRPLPDDLPYREDTVEIPSVTVHEWYRQRRPSVASLLYRAASRYVRRRRTCIWLANVDARPGEVLTGIDHSLHGALRPLADGKLFEPRPYHARLIDPGPPEVWSNLSIPTWGELERWFNGLLHGYPEVFGRVFGPDRCEFDLYGEWYRNDSKVY